MKTNLRVATYSKIDNNNNVVIIESTQHNGKTKVLSTVNVIQLPPMVASERNQMVDFVKTLTSKDPLQIAFNVSVKFNKVRRTFLRDIVKIQNSLNEWVTWEVGDDGKAVYAYKAELLDENSAREAFEANKAKKMVSKKPRSDKDKAKPKS